MRFQLEKSSLVLNSLTHSVFRGAMTQEDGKKTMVFVLAPRQQPAIDKNPTYQLDLHDEKFRFYTDFDLAGHAFTELTATRPLMTRFKGVSFSQLKESLM